MKLVEELQKQLAAVGGSPENVEGAPSPPAPRPPTPGQPWLDPHVAARHSIPSPKFGFAPPALSPMPVYHRTPPLPPPPIQPPAHVPHVIPAPLVYRQALAAEPSAAPATTRDGVAMFVNSARHDERFVTSGLDLLNEASELQTAAELTREQSVEPADLAPTGTTTPVTADDHFELIPFDRAMALLDWYRDYVQVRALRCRSVIECGHAAFHAAARSASTVSSAHAAQAILPILIWPKFIATVYKTYEHGTVVQSLDRLWLATLTLTLATSCHSQLSEDTVANQRLSKTLFRRARTLAPLAELVFMPNDPAVVQYLQLVAQCVRRCAD